MLRNIDASDDTSRLSRRRSRCAGLFVGDRHWRRRSGGTVDNVVHSIEALGPAGPMGDELAGPSVQSKVTNVSWRQTSKDAPGNTMVVERKSIDWTSQQTEVSVYFCR
jgi:hypothetical protein